MRAVGPLICCLVLLPGLFSGLVFAQSAPSATQQPLPTTIGTGVAVEGDVISVNGSVVRLWGIDAPDKGQTCTNRLGQSYDCFEQAKAMLSRLVGQNQVTCYVRGQDHHGQKLGTCAVAGLDLAAMVVREGWAMSFASLSPQYTLMEGIAQSNKRGMWNGRATAPWLWRTEQVAAGRNK